MKNDSKQHQPEKQQNSLHVILGLALLLLSVVLALNLDTHLSGGVTFQSVINILAILLFCGVGLSLLIGALHRMLHNRTKRKHS